MFLTVRIVTRIPGSHHTDRNVRKLWRIEKSQSIAELEHSKTVASGPLKQPPNRTAYCLEQAAIPCRIAK